jgi:exopolysaccharide production protein ExoZ
LAYFKSIQILRFFAAALVVVSHATQAYDIRVLGGDGSSYWHFGTFGVDVFFVISGFVMASATRDYESGWQSALYFFKRRLIRVVPLYWFFTSVKVILVLAIPALSIKELPTVFHVVSSYLFIPFGGGGGDYWPVLSVGWTLNFEILFYLCFAISVAIFHSRVLGVALLFLFIFVFASVVFNETAFSFYKNSILFEFLFGMLIGERAEKISRFGERFIFGKLIALVLIFFACFAVFLSDGSMRGLFWGVPAAVVVIGGVLLEKFIGGRLASIFQAFGDSSYSLYLSHAFTVPVVIIVASSLLPLGLFSLIVLCLVFSIFIAECCHRCLEKPVTNYLVRLTSSTLSPKARLT